MAQVLYLVLPAEWRESLQNSTAFCGEYSRRGKPSRTMQDFPLCHLVFLQRKFVVEVASFAYTFQWWGGGGGEGGGGPRGQEGKTFKVNQNLVWTKMQKRNEAHGLFFISVGKYVKCMKVKKWRFNFFNLFACFFYEIICLGSITRDFVYSTLFVFAKSLAKTANFYHLPRAFTPVVYIFS